MLHVGLTGGIGAGKSTVAAVLAECGAEVIDADVIAREVVAPGTPGLDALVGEFGPQIRNGSGELDRARLAEQVFGDDDARKRLNAVVHPLVRSETDRQIAAMPPDAVVVHDIPLLVENGMSAEYHLVVIVGADRDTRIARLQRDRGMTLAQVESRMSAQADEQQRHRIADVWIDNGQGRDEARRQVMSFWQERASPYAANLAGHRRAPRPPRVQIIDPPQGPRTWPVQAEQLLDRLRRAGGAEVRSAHHIGSTAVPGLAAKDVIDLQLGVESLGGADRIAARLAESGFPRCPGEWYDSPRGLAGEEEGTWPKTFHANADPVRAVNVHIRVAGSPGWRFALMFRDWFRSEPSARQEYQQLKVRLAAEVPTGDAYAAAKERWFEAAAARMAAWAQRTGWRPPPTAPAPRG